MTDPHDSLDKALSEILEDMPIMLPTVEHRHWWASPPEGSIMHLIANGGEKDGWEARLDWDGYAGPSWLVWNYDGEETECFEVVSAGGMVYALVDVYIQSDLSHFDAYFHPLRIIDGELQIWTGA